MSAGFLHGIWTVILGVTFIGIVLWAFSSRRRTDFERAAQIPFTDEPTAAEGDEDRHA